MSYAGTGTVEIDFTGGNPYPYPYPPPRTTYVRTYPPTKAETAVGIVLGIAVIGLIGLAIWKAPKTAWVSRPYYPPEPTVRLRFNRKRRHRRRQ